MCSTDTCKDVFNPNGTFQLIQIAVSDCTSVLFIYHGAKLGLGLEYNRLENKRIQHT